jgi:putative peptidoglycan lipid II flippase
MADQPTPAVSESLLPIGSSQSPPVVGRTSVARAAGLITLGNLSSRVLGLVREGVIGYLFGPTVDTSAFRTAATVPTMLYDLVIGGAVSAALIPVFSEYAARDEARGKLRDGRASELGRVAGTIGLVALLVTVAAAVLLGAFAPGLVSLLGVDESSGAREQAILLVRIVLPSVVFLGLSGVVTAILYARQSFAFPAFAVACYNAGIIVGGLLLTPVLGVRSLVVGVLLGAFGQLLFQVVGLRRSGLRLGIDFRHPAVRRVLVLYAPVAFGLVVSQLGVIIDRNLAWRIGPDSVAVMGFATTLIQLPLGLVATATSFAVLPQLSRLAAEAEGAAEFRRTLDSGLRLAFLAILPATVALVTLGEPIIRLLFERGAFDIAGSHATATALLFYAPQLPFVAVDQLLIFAFYARKNTLTPALVGLLGVGIYLVSGLALSGPAGLGLRGLVLANTLQNSLHALVLFWLLRRQVGTILEPKTLAVALKALVAAAPLGAISLLVANLLPDGARPGQILVGLAVAGAAGGGAYVLALFGLGVSDVVTGWRYIQARLIGKNSRQD